MKDFGVAGVVPVGGEMVARTHGLHTPRKARMTRLATMMALLLCATGSLRAEDLAVERVLAWYHLLRPTEKDLAVYRLNWTGSLDEAQQRAAREGRPICLVIIHSKYGDIASGHC